MILPTIHLNGTSAAMLRDDYLEARTAVRDAADRLARVEFNARDYYVQGPGVWNLARDEHQARLSMLESIAGQLLTIAEHCQEAIDAKEAQRASQEVSS